MEEKAGFQRWIKLSVGDMPSIRAPKRHMLANLTGGLEDLYINVLRSKVEKDEASCKLKDTSRFTDEEGEFAPQTGMPLMAARYKFVEVLARGQSALIVKALDTFANEKWIAIKVLHKVYKPIGSQEADILLEVHRADPWSHVPFARLLNQFIYGSHYCLVFEYLSPTPLYDHYEDKNIIGPQSIPHVRNLCVKLLTVLGFFHKQNIIHADLKPENILLKDEDDMSSVMVVDFGNALRNTEEELSLYYNDYELQTLLYRAPEVIFGLKFSLEIDMWSLGCLLAECYIGQPIFIGNSKTELLTKITKLLGPFPKEFSRGECADTFTEFIGKPLSRYERVENLRKSLNSCQDMSFLLLLERLLTYHPEKRASPFEAACHPFIASTSPFLYMNPSTDQRRYPPVLLDQPTYPFVPDIPKHEEEDPSVTATRKRLVAYSMPPKPVPIPIPIPKIEKLEKNLEQIHLKVSNPSTESKIKQSQTQKSQQQQSMKSPSVPKIPPVKPQPVYQFQVPKNPQQPLAKSPSSCQAKPQQNKPPASPLPTAAKSQPPIKLQAQPLKKPIPLAKPLPTSKSLQNMKPQQLQTKSVAQVKPSHSHKPALAKPQPTNKPLHVPKPQAVKPQPQPPLTKTQPKPPFTKTQPQLPLAKPQPKPLLTKPKIQGNHTSLVRPQGAQTPKAFIPIKHPQVKSATLTKALNKPQLIKPQALRRSLSLSPPLRAPPLVQPKAVLPSQTPPENAISSPPNVNPTLASEEAPSPMEVGQDFRSPSPPHSDEQPLEENAADDNLEADSSNLDCEDPVSSPLQGMEEDEGDEAAAAAAAAAFRQLQPSPTLSPNCIPASPTTSASSVSPTPTPSQSQPSSTMKTKVKKGPQQQQSLQFPGPDFSRTDVKQTLKSMGLRCEDFTISVYSREQAHAILRKQGVEVTNHSSGKPTNVPKGPPMQQPAKVQQKGNSITSPSVNTPKPDPAKSAATHTPPSQPQVASSTSKDATDDDDDDDCIILDPPPDAPRPPPPQPRRFPQQFQLMGTTVQVNRGAKRRMRGLSHAPISKRPHLRSPHYYYNEALSMEEHPESSVQDTLKRLKNYNISITCRRNSTQKQKLHPMDSDSDQEDHEGAMDSEDEEDVAKYLECEIDEKEQLDEEEIDGDKTFDLDSSNSFTNDVKLENEAVNSFSAAGEERREATTEDGMASESDLADEKYLAETGGEGDAEKPDALEQNDPMEATETAVAKGTLSSPIPEPTDEDLPAVAAEDSEEIYPSEEPTPQETTNSNEPFAYNDEAPQEDEHFDDYEEDAEGEGVPPSGSPTSYKMQTENLTTMEEDEINEIEKLLDSGNLEGVDDMDEECLQMEKNL